ncbi:unnamed protein product, partial [Rotaria magnacalcarata]
MKFACFNIDIGIPIAIKINEANDFHNAVTHFSGLDPSQISEANKDYFPSLCKTYENNINIDEAIIEYDTFKDVLASIRSSLSIV